jgi:hypothetical protein
METLEKWHKNGGICIISNILFKNMVNAAWSGIAEEVDSGKDEGEPREDESKEVVEKEEKIIDILLRDPSIVVVDEVHALKNHKAQMNRAASKISTPLKIAVAGTTPANSAVEYMTLVRWITPDVVIRFMETKNSRGLEEQMQDITAMARPIKHRNNVTGKQDDWE